MGTYNVMKGRRCQGETAPLRARELRPRREGLAEPRLLLSHDDRLRCVAWRVQGTILIHRTRYLLIKYTYSIPSESTWFNVTVSTILPAFLIWLTPGATWFHHELIPAPHEQATVIDARTRMAIWQLGNCTSGVKRFLSPC